MWTDATVAMATNKYRLLWEYARMICTATHSLTHMYTYIHKCASEKNRHKQYTHHPSRPVTACILIDTHAIVHMCSPVKS